jgi:uncharacterized protein YbaR (Trm112 family)
MPTKAALPIKIEDSILSQLACPACQGDLHFHLDGDSRSGAPANAGRVLCRSCGRAYPMVDGIPVLIVERALLESRG